MNLKVKANCHMNAFTKKVSLGAVFAWSLLSGVQAAKLPGEATVSTSRVHWTLSTADTRLKLSVSNNKIHIDSLKNPAQGWNWVPVASEVPLPGKNSIRSAGVTGGYRPDSKLDVCRGERRQKRRI